MPQRRADFFARCRVPHPRRLERGTDSAEARRERTEADFQTRRALKLAPNNDEVKTLCAVITHRPEEALQAYEEALKIYRELAQKDSESYLPGLASVLNNLALLDTDQNRPEEAQKAYEEALTIRRLIVVGSWRRSSTAVTTMRVP